MFLLMFLGCTSPQPTLVPEGEQFAEVPSVDPITIDDANSNAPRQDLEAAVLDAAARDAAVRDAVERALPFVEREGTAWMEGRVSIQGGSPCVSCHHVGYALWSHAEARRVGIDTKAEAFQSLAETAITFLDRPTIPRALSAGQVMLAEPQQAASLSPHMLELQNVDGDWDASGQFPSQDRPIAESDAIATMSAILALREVGADDPDSASHTKALTWLDQQPSGKTTEWLAWRLLLANAQGAEDTVQELHRTLTERQREDGGWGWLDTSESDAFSTGQALYALSRITTPSSNATAAPEAGAAESAIRFLLERQGEDGSWHTASELISEEGSSEKDVIYDFWGTAWATLGLARSLEAKAVDITMPDRAIGES